MKTFAVLQNNTVSNIIIAESKEIAEDVSRAICVESENAGIGWIYNEDTGDFINPVSVELPNEEITS